MNQGSKRELSAKQTCSHVNRWVGAIPNLKKHWIIDGQVSYVMFAATGDAGIVRANDRGRPYNVGGQ